MNERVLSSADDDTRSAADATPPPSAVAAALKRSRPRSSTEFRPNFERNSRTEFRIVASRETRAGVCSRALLSQSNRVPRKDVLVPNAPRSRAQFSPSPSLSLSLSLSQESVRPARFLRERKGKMFVSLRKQARAPRVSGDASRVGKFTAPHFLTPIVAARDDREPCTRAPNNARATATHTGAGRAASTVRTDPIIIIIIVISRGRLPRSAAASQHIREYSRDSREGRPRGPRTCSDAPHMHRWSLECKNESELVEEPRPWTPKLDAFKVCNFLLRIGKTGQTRFGARLGITHPNGSVVTHFPKCRQYGARTAHTRFLRS